MIFSKLKSKSNKKIIALITVFLFIFSAYGVSFASAGAVSGFNFMTPKQQFLSSLMNTSQNSKKMLGSYLSVNNDAPVEEGMSFKFGEDSTMLDGTDFSDLKAFSFDSVMQFDPVNKRSSNDFELKLNNQDLLTANLYADNDIIALKIKELFNKVITADNSNLINTFNNLGIPGFPFDNIDLSSTQPTIDITKYDGYTDLFEKYKNILISNLDDSSFSSVAEDRTVDGTALSGTTVTMDVNGVQLVSLLDALLSSAKDDIQLKGFIKQVYNDYISSVDPEAVLMTDDDISAMFDSIYSSFNSSIQDIENYIKEIKVQLFIVDSLIVQSSVLISVSSDFDNFSITASTTNLSSSFNYDCTVKYSVKAQPDAEFKNLSLVFSGYSKNISEVVKYQPSSDDIKLESLSQTGFNDVMTSISNNFTSLVNNTPELKRVVKALYPPQIIDVTPDNYGWAYAEINTLYYSGIINGKGETDQGIIYDPGACVTRAEATKLIVSAYNIIGSGSDAGFKDVTPGSWYYDYVGAAYKNNLVQGKSADYFDPNSSITREELCTIVVRTKVSYDGWELITNNDAEFFLDDFADSADVSEWAKGYIATAVQRSIILGTPDQGQYYIRPLSNTTRAEAAVIIYRMLYYTYG